MVRRTLLRKLGERRLAEGLTQNQTAKSIGISAKSLSFFVNGKGSLNANTISKIQVWAKGNGHSVIKGKGFGTFIDRATFNVVNGLDVPAESKLNVLNGILN